MSEVLGTFGAALVLAWAVLPILALIARGSEMTPASRQRALTFALLLSAMMFLVPFLRVWTHHFTALCLSAQSAAATIVLAPTRALSDGNPALLLLQFIGLFGVLVIVAGTIRLSANTLSLRSVVARSHPAPAELRAMAARLATKLNLPLPEVRTSCEAAVPFVTKNTVVVPEVLLASLDQEELALVLAHELTHLDRKDVELAWLVAIFRIPFSLHPAARWIAREIAVAREEAVDALVGAESPYAYARLLVDVAAHARFGRCSSLVAMEPSNLERRISELIDPSRASRRRTLPVVVAGFVLLFLTMIAPRPAETRPIVSAWGICVEENPPPQPASILLEMPIEEACQPSVECGTE